MLNTLRDTLICPICDINYCLLINNQINKLIYRGVINYGKTKIY